MPARFWLQAGRKHDHCTDALGVIFFVIDMPDQGRAVE